MSEMKNVRFIHPLGMGYGNSETFAKVERLILGNYTPVGQQHARGFQEYLVCYDPTIVKDLYDLGVPATTPILPPPWLVNGLALYTIFDVGIPSVTPLFTSLRGGNHQGQRVGFYEDANTHEQHGYLFDKASGFKLVDFPGADVPQNVSMPKSGAIGINDNGLIVGIYQKTGQTHPYLYDGSFQAIDYQRPSGSVVVDITFPRGINSDGWIVGMFRDNTTQKRHGFIRDPTVTDPATAFSDPIVGTFMLSSTVEADTIFSGINDKGDIVGYYTDLMGLKHGLFWERSKSGTQMRAIDMPPLATPFTDFQLNALSSHSSHVVGHFYDPAGGYHGFEAEL